MQVASVLVYNLGGCICYLCHLEGIAHPGCLRGVGQSTGPVGTVRPSIDDQVVEGVAYGISLYSSFDDVKPVK